jgi:uncharacterized protein (DUF885 family)
MRLAHALALALSLSVATCKPDEPTKPPVVKPKPAGPTFAQSSEAILAAWFAGRPTTATNLGEHAHDGKWIDLTPAGIAADKARIDQGLVEVRRLAGTELTADERIDLDMLRAELELQLFGHEVEQPWRRDPLWVTGTIGSGLEDLVSREFAPVDERAASVAARLEGLPAFCEQAAASIVAEEAYPPQTRVSIGQIDGIVVLVEKVLPQRLEQASPEAKAKVAAATPPAVAALKALQTKLSTEVAPVAKGNWRLGAENFTKKLELTLQSNITAEDLRRVAVVEHGRVRQKMTELARELAGEVLSASKVRRIESKGGDADTEIVRAVLEELAAIHPTPEQLRDAIEAKLANLSAFVKEQAIVTMDDAEVLQVIWTPPHQRGVFIAGLAAPGPLEKQAAGLPSFYLVQPVPEDWPAAQRESFLREYNDFMLEILSIHEAIPGHFVQLYYAKREPSKVRRVLANGPFVEGWAVYAEKLMVDAGYAGPGPAAGAKRPRGVSKSLWKVMQSPDLRAKAIALHGLKFYLRSVTNAILDNGVHAGTMIEEEAIKLMVERSFQQEGEARAKWVRAQVTSTQLSTYFVGAQAWLRLRAHAESQARGADQPFDMAKFHDAALSHGAPPVHRIAILLGWGEDHPAIRTTTPGAAPAAAPATTPAAEPTLATEPAPAPAG